LGRVGPGPAGAATPAGGSRVEPHVRPSSGPLAPSATPARPLASRRGARYAGWGDDDRLSVGDATVSRAADRHTGLRCRWRLLVRMNRSIRVGVDIGGTFTDIVFLDTDGRIQTKKVPSSRDNDARAPG